MGESYRRGADLAPVLVTAKRYGAAMNDHTHTKRRKPGISQLLADHHPPARTRPRSSETRADLDVARLAEAGLTAVIVYAGEAARCPGCRPISGRAAEAA